MEKNHMIISTYKEKVFVKFNILSEGTSLNTMKAIHDQPITAVTSNG